MRAALFVVALSAGAVTSSSCTPAASSTPTPATPASPTPATPTARVPDNATGALLVAYEATRAALADDDAGRVAATADVLAAAAAAYRGAGQDDVVAGAKALDVLVKDAAAPAGEATAAYFAAARVAFGTVSRGVVAAIAADATLQEGRSLFECPMAQGYQRWVQTTPKMANPYMGRVMLECGTAVPVWRVEG